MKIIAEVWGSWVTKESLVTPAKRVGVSRDGLSIQNMQQEKFSQAELCLQSNEVAQKKSNVVMSPKHVRKNTAEYWKTKYEMAQSIINENHERSLKLDEIPDFLKINTVKQKAATTSNTRVTQVHGSLEGKDVRKLVQSIKHEKEQKQIAKEKRPDQKNQEKEAFHRCKERCVCHQERCMATSLKECPSCHDILKSVCTKAHCKQKDGPRPVMITAAAAQKSCVRLDTKFAVESDENETYDTESEEEAVTDQSDDESSDDAKLEADVIAGRYSFDEMFKAKSWFWKCFE